MEPQSETRGTWCSTYTSKRKVATLTSHPTFSSTCWEARSPPQSSSRTIAIWRCRFVKSASGSRLEPSTLSTESTLGRFAAQTLLEQTGVDPQLAILVAGGTGICGAAAVMGLSGSIKVPPEKEDEKANNEVMAVAIIAIMGTIFALLEIALGPLTGLSKTQLGITAGASLHEIAHAVAAGDAFGAVGIATIMKLSRVLMLVFAAIIIAVWWDKNHSEMPADGKRKVSFPWFMLGFIGASIIGTFVPFIGAIAPNLVDFAYIVLGMAMAALGINVNFSAIAKKGQKAFLASFLTSVLLMCFAAGIAALFF